MVPKKSGVILVTSSDKDGPLTPGNFEKGCTMRYVKIEHYDAYLARRSLATAVFAAHISCFSLNCKVLIKFTSACEC